MFQKLITYSIRHKLVIGVLYSPGDMGCLVAGASSFRFHPGHYR